MDSIRPLTHAVVCGMYQDVSNRSFNPIGCQVKLHWQHLKLIVVILKPILNLNHFSFVAKCIIVLKETTAIKEYCFHEKVYMFCKA